jgi:hypothetical protein
MPMNKKLHAGYTGYILTNNFTGYMLMNNFKEK